MAKKADTPKEPTREEIIDELGRLDAEIAADGIATKLTRIKTLRETVRAWSETEPAEKPLLYEGKAYSVTLTPRENQRSIRSLQAVYKALGIAKFIVACSLTLKALEEAVGKENIGKYVTEERTGSRTVATFARKPAA